MSNKNTQQNYYLGLDIGTDSVGWAVCDQNYNILKAKGKKLWGVRLFDQAKTAADRRTFRSNRRRRERQKLRLSWLRELFAPEISKLDPLMLDRMKYSALWEEDKQNANVNLKSKDSLFQCKIDGKEYTDKDFYKEYPTAYHLRRELTMKPAKDVRFLYLAIHSILKSRGHFLYEGELESSKTLFSILNEIKECLLELGDEIYDISFDASAQDFAEVEACLISKNHTVKEKKSLFYNKLNITTNKYAKNLVNSLVDGKFNLKNIFPIEVEENIVLDFNSDDESQLQNAESVLSENQLILVDKIHEFYSALQLKRILGDYEYICDAMVNSYNLHKTQLKDFKDFIRTYYYDEYSRIFRYSDKKPERNNSKELTEGQKQANNQTNYALYVYRDIINSQKQVLGTSGSERTKEAFYKFVKDIITKEPKECVSNKELFEEKRQQILNLINDESFLPKQRTKNNAVFPNKLLLKELDKILEVNAKAYPFLEQKDETGLTVAEKIKQILTFRVPYYVGPIGGREESPFAWSKKISEQKLYPWTLNKIVDLNQSEDVFISRMTGKCSYLHDQDVLPKHSLIYEKFMVLNQLNLLKINGAPISVELKQKIFNDLFKNFDKVSISKLKSYLIAEGIYTKEEANALCITGIDKQFTTTYGTYVKLAKKFGSEFIEKNLDTIETFIKYATIISDKNRLKNRLQKEFGQIFTSEQLDALKGFTYSGWGNLSKEFLVGLSFANVKTGEVTNITCELWRTNQNLQQILNNKDYTLENTLFEREKKSIQDLVYDDINQLYCSPSVKRSIWQTVLIIKELVGVLGQMPDKIFVEVTRKHEKTGSIKDSRLKSLQDKYSKMQENVYLTKTQLDELMDELNKTDNNRLRSEKLYLYFTQNGCCAYSGERINIADLYNDNLYDVDHIIPQATLKDDSIENKVLVKKTINSAKDKKYPLNPEIINKMQKMWESWYNAELIGKKKLSNLIRKTPLSNDEISGFIARQLVETNQSTKAVIDFLKQMMDKPNKVVYCKACYVSDFRNSNAIWKSRTVNDYHHAKDAYLNIVVGNILNCRFTDDPKHFNDEINAVNSKCSTNPIKVLAGKVYSPITHKLIWNHDKDIQKIQQNCYSNSPLVSKMSFSNPNQEFYDSTIYKSTKNSLSSKVTISLKGSNNPLSNIQKYGGYNSIKGAYFTLAEAKELKKDTPVKMILSVPSFLEYTLRKDPNKQAKIIAYLEQENNLKDVKLLLNKINYQSTLLIGDGEYWLGGKTNDYLALHNANEWKVDNETTRYVKNLEKYDRMKTSKSYMLEEKDDEIILSEAATQNNVELKITKKENIKLYNQIIGQLSKKIYDGLSLSTSLKTKLIKNKDGFYQKDVRSQADELLNTLKGLSTGAQTPNGMGAITINQNITNKKIYLLIKSPTGIFERKLRL